MYAEYDIVRSDFDEIEDSNGGFDNMFISTDYGATQLEIDESSTNSPRFKVGDMIEWSGLYGGSYTGKISKITDSSVTVDVSWTSEDDGRLITKPSTYPIEKDGEGNDCIIVWEYHGHKGYVYPPEMDMRESSDMKDIEDAPYSSSFMKDRGEVTINGESYVKIAKNKWEHHPKQSNAIGGTYSDKEIHAMMNESSDSDKSKVARALVNALDDEDIMRAIGSLSSINPSLYKKASAAIQKGDKSLSYIAKEISDELMTESKDTDNLAQELRIKIQSALHKFMTSPRCGFPEDEVKDYSRVEVELIDTDYGKAIKAEVRAELSFGALSDLCNELDPIIGYYEQGAYFEPEQPGIIVAYLAV